MWPARDTRPRTSAALALLLLAGAAASAAGATFVDPALRFRTLRTPHFIVYFHERDSRTATRVGRTAEQVWQTFRANGLGTLATTHVLLVDQTDAANGWATPLPRNTILLTAAWPSGAEFIGHTDEWLRTVIEHELTHIAQLQRSGGWAAGVRRIFGRVPLAFPNLFLPVWQIEGLATFQESVKGSGRLHAPEFRALPIEAAREGRPVPLDRVNGGLTDWPGGHGPYAHGALFHEYLAGRFGPAALAELADRTSRRVPYLSSGAFTSTFGVTLGDLWRDFTATLAPGPAPGPRPGDAQIRRLTAYGFTTTGPRSVAACAGCVEDVIYARRDPHAFPSIAGARLDGAAGRLLGERFLGRTSGVHGPFVVFDQQDLRRNVAQVSDLFLLDRRSRTIARLSTGARLIDPDWSRDGRYLVAVREQGGARELVVGDLGGLAWTEAAASSFAGLVDAARGAVRSPRVLAAERDTQFNAPRWSPDGRAIVVERHRPGRGAEIVVVDAASGAVTATFSARGGRMTTPTWGARGDTILAAVQVGGEAFEIHEFAVDRPGLGRRLTQWGAGATWPEVTRDGQSLVFVGYTDAGYDVYAMPLPDADVVPFSPLADALRATPGAAAEPIAQEDGSIAAASSPPLGAAAPYAPVRTLLPTSWTPVIEAERDEVRLGLATAGADVLGYHGYAAAASWVLSAPRGSPRPSSPDWQIGYAYARWRPTWFAGVESRTSFLAVGATAGGLSIPGLRRTRQVESGVVLPFRRVRVAQEARVSLLWADDADTLADRVSHRRRVTGRVRWFFDSSRLYDAAISREDGLTAIATAEFSGRDGGVRPRPAAVTGDLRGYLPGGGRHHVLALRAAGGWRSNRPETGGPFLLGGSAASGGGFGRDELSLLRGFPTNAFAGSRLFVANADYRWPLISPQRGIGTWPAFLHTLHAAVFADAAHAWSRRRLALGDAKLAFGAELSARLVVGYAQGLTLTVGSAWTRDGAGLIASGANAYVRVGRAF